MANTINASNIADFLANAAWAVHAAYHTVLKTSPGVAIFGRDMLFDIPFLADWSINRGIQTKTKGQEFCQRKLWPCRLGLSTWQ